MINPDTFKIRCSAIGQIMTNDRSGKGMGQMPKTYCQKWLTEQIYGKRMEFTSKEIEKGVQMEDEAIQLISRYYFNQYEKNEKQYSDDYKTGTPDIVTFHIRDIKCAWDCYTFPLWETELPNTAYYWQVQGYMSLTGLDVAYIDYCLMDTPEHLYIFGNMSIDQEDKLINYHTYSNLPDFLRVKSFLVKRDDDAIQSINDRVDQCREYIAELIKRIE
jgi:hypothetical protein